jgi:Ribbon-helix-helix protein, copG family
MVDTRCKKRDEMTRTSIFSSDRQIEDLKRLLKKEDLSVAELIRRAIDQFLERKKKAR